MLFLKNISWVTILEIKSHTKETLKIHARPVAVENTNRFLTLKR